MTRIALCLIRTGIPRTRKSVRTPVNESPSWRQGDEAGRPT
jgi:hypothetical protein